MTDYRKCTIVSVVPFTIREFKPTLYPCDYIIPAAPYPNGVSSLIINGAMGFIYLDGERGQLRVNIAAEEVADSLVNDYARSHVGIRENARPGLFFEVGDWEPEQAKKQFPDRIKKAMESQREWFKNLVTLADDDWARYRQYKFVSNLQRIAAKHLNLERPWISVALEDEQICPACRSKIDPLAVICGSCKFILKPDQYKTMTFAER
jgi:hypothetical protein